MSRGPGRTQRFILEQLHQPTPPGQWPPWITVEALAARYVGEYVDELVMARDDDRIWRTSRLMETSTPRASEHLLGLSAERSTKLVSSQRLPRSAVESTRRAVKSLGADGRIHVW